EFDEREIVRIRKPACQRRLTGSAAPEYDNSVHRTSLPEKNGRHRTSSPRSCTPSCRSARTVFWERPALTARPYVAAWCRLFVDDIAVAGHHRDFSLRQFGLLFWCQRIGSTNLHRHQLAVRVEAVGVDRARGQRVRPSVFLCL